MERTDIYIEMGFLGGCFPSLKHKGQALSTDSIGHGPRQEGLNSPPETHWHVPVGLPP